MPFFFKEGINMTEILGQKRKAHHFMLQNSGSQTLEYKQTPEGTCKNSKFLGPSLLGSNTETQKQGTVV